MKFTQFLLEKNMQDGKDRSRSLYLWGDISPKIQQKYRAIVTYDENDITEEESTPHTTLIYLPEVTGLSEYQIYDIINPILSGKSYEVYTKEFEIFKGVNHGKEDCLVVRLTTNKDILNDRDTILKELTKAGAKFKETYEGDWKAHMTIAYFNLNSHIEFQHFKPTTIQIDQIKFQFGGQSAVKREFGKKKVIKENMFDLLGGTPTPEPEPEIKKLPKIKKEIPFHKQMISKLGEHGFSSSDNTNYSKEGHPIHFTVHKHGKGHIVQAHSPSDFLSTSTTMDSPEHIDNFLK